MGDRCRDLFPFWHTCEELGDDVTIRVAQDRRMASDEAEPALDADLLHLTSRARHLPVQERRVLHLPAGHDRPARDALLDVNVAPMCIQPPVHNASLHKTPLHLWGVRVWEPSPPAGVEPLEWMVLTSVPVLTCADAWERVRWYRCRWLIEAFHTVLTSGWCMETRRMHTVSARQNLVAVLTPIGLQRLHLCQVSQVQPDLPATQVVSQDVLQILAWLDQRPHPHWTVRDLCCTVARFGGFLSRPCDGLPGWQTLWKGWVFLQTVLLGVHLAALLPPS